MCPDCLLVWSSGPCPECYGGRREGRTLLIDFTPVPRGQELGKQSAAELGRQLPVLPMDDVSGTSADTGGGTSEAGEERTRGNTDGVGQQEVSRHIERGYRYTDDPWICNNERWIVSVTRVRGGKRRRRQRTELGGGLDRQQR